jgi:Uncharacterized conserved protein
VTFRTVAERASTAFEVRGSEFVGHVAPVRGVAAAEAFVTAVREEYDDATHNVPAYRVPASDGQSTTDGRRGTTDDDRSTAHENDESNGTNDDTSSGEWDDTSGDGPNGEPMLREYADDDGEPSGSAGDPALNVLVQRNVRNVVVVVTRYYGGTNLGVGGLARAYGRATAEAIDAAGVVERRPRERFTVCVVYDDSGIVRSTLERADCEFDADYAEQVTFTVRVPTEEAASVRDRLRSVTSGRARIE